MFGDLQPTDNTLIYKNVYNRVVDIVDIFINSMLQETHNT